jgi:hypothetical protein
MDDGQAVLHGHLPGAALADQAAGAQKTGSSSLSVEG